MKANQVHSKFTAAPKIPILDIGIPIKRGICVFCNARLTKGAKYKDMNICTSDGVAVLVCSKHAEMGDRLVHIVHKLAREALTVELS